MIAYKLFRLRKNNTISPLFINKGQIIPMGRWLEAEPHRTKGFAFRPGWHSTHAPKAPHLSNKGRAWYEVDIDNYVELKRTKKQGGKWYLSKWIKVNRRLP